MTAIAHFANVGSIVGLISLKTGFLISPIKKVYPDFPQLTERDCQQAVQLIEPDGTVYAAAEAVLRTLTYTKHYAWLYRLYQKSRLFASVAESFYSWVAKNRDFFTRIGL